LKYVMVTNIPAPYREKVHENVSKYFWDEYLVVYADKKESNREWQFDDGNYKKIFLKKFLFEYKEKFIHINFDVWTILNKYNPQVVITCGFNPTFLMAFLWAKLKHKKHICMTDGGVGSEKRLSFLHRLVRKVVYKYSDAFIGASDKSLDLYRCYRCDENKLFKSCLCIDNDYYAKFIKKMEDRKYDIMFSGRFVDGKMPMFFAEICDELNKKIIDLKVLIIGDGELKSVFLDKLQEYKINFDYPGFIDQKKLPLYYADSKILLFPTKTDTWGIVANEACAVGTPVITMESAGVSGELVKHDYNGYILDLNIETWAKYSESLLKDNKLHSIFSKNSLEEVKNYSYRRAAKGIIDAINYVKIKNKKRSKKRWIN